MLGLSWRNQRLFCGVRTFITLIQEVWVCVGLTRWRTTLPVRTVTEGFIVVPQNGQISRRRVNIEQVVRGKVLRVIKGELQIGALGCAYGKGNLKMEKDSLAADGRVIRYRASGARKGATRLCLR